MTPQTQVEPAVPTKIQTLGESSFRNVWKMTENQPSEVRLAQLLGNLESWVGCSVAEKDGSKDLVGKTLVVPLEGLELGAYQEMRQHVRDAIKDGWRIERLVAAITLTGLADAGMNL
jgi:hypothetical protein